MPSQCSLLPTSSVLVVIPCGRHQADNLLIGAKKSSDSYEGRTDALCQVPELTLPFEWEGAVLYGYQDSTANAVDTHPLQYRHSNL